MTDTVSIPPIINEKVIAIEKINEKNMYNTVINQRDKLLSMFSNNNDTNVDESESESESDSDDLNIDVDLESDNDADIDAADVNDDKSDDDTKSVISTASHRSYSASLKKKAIKNISKSNISDLSTLNYLKESEDPKHLIHAEAMRKIESFNNVNYKQDIEDKIRKLSELKITVNQLISERNDHTFDDILKFDTKTPIEEIDSAISSINIFIDSEQNYSSTEEVLVTIANAIESFADGTKNIPLLGRINYKNLANSIKKKLHSQKIPISTYVNNIARKVPPVGRFILPLAFTFISTPFANKLNDRNTNPNNIKFDDPPIKTDSLTDIFTKI